MKLVHPEGTDQFFLFRVSDGERFELNEVAFEMVRRMDGTAAPSAICECISAEFEGAEDVRSDLEELVRSLVEAGVAELTSPGQG